VFRASSLPKATVPEELFECLRFGCIFALLGATDVSLDFLFFE